MADSMPLDIARHAAARILSEFRAFQDLERLIETAANFEAQRGDMERALANARDELGGLRASIEEAKDGVEAAVHGANAARALAAAECQTVEREHAVALELLRAGQEAEIEMVREHTREVREQAQLDIASARAHAEAEKDRLTESLRDMDRQAAVARARLESLEAEYAAFKQRVGV